MNYTIKELDEFSVIGREVELTNSQKRNMDISMEFWRSFNVALKKSYLSQSGNWTKYAFMERRQGKLYYYCAVPKGAVVPQGFSLKKIKPHKYLVADHIGTMKNIYQSYNEIYKEVIPVSGCVPMQDEFLHFERYDYRFYWNSDNSIIEIWIPVQGKIEEG